MTRGRVYYDPGGTGTCLLLSRRERRVELGELWPRKDGRTNALL